MFSLSSLSWIFFGAPPFSTAVVGTAAAGVSTPGYAIILSLLFLLCAPPRQIISCAPRGSSVAQRLSETRARDDAIN